MGQGYLQRVLTILEEINAEQEMLTVAVMEICTETEKTRMRLIALTASVDKRTRTLREDRSGNIRRM
jgi:hypothetical protein